MRATIRRCTRTLLLAFVFATIGTQRVDAQALATYQLGAGWATFGVVLPQAAATGGVALGSLQTQTDVKTRWPDGSIRFAVVTAQVPTAGAYAITAASAAPGTASPVTPDASVRLQIGGTAYTAVVPSIGTDTWLSGPVVTEWRSTVTPSTSSGAQHPFLRVLFDTRVYRDGQTRLDVTVENVLDVSGATAVTYTVDVIASGATVFTKANVAHPWTTRWRKVFGLGGFAAATVTPDVEPAIAANALPRYMTSVNNLVWTATGPDFEILGKGGLNPYMPDPGGRQEIAPYPDWTARYLVFKNPTQKGYVLAHGDLAGSWPVHIREANGRLVSIDERPNFWLDPRCDQDGLSCPRGDLNARGPLTPDNAHQPSLAYVPYLLTGDRYYADEMAFWANYEFFGDNWPPERKGSQGLLDYPQPRGFAWALRNLGDAALYLPDAHPNKPYFIAKMNNNLKWADDYADGRIAFGRWGNGPHPLGITFYYDDGTGVPRTAIWETNYIAWTLDHLLQQGVTGGDRLRNKIVDLQLRLFTNEPEYPRPCAAPYRPMVGQQNGALYTTLAQLAASACNPIEPFVGYYGIDARLMLLIAERRSLAGATGAYDYLMGWVGSDGVMVDYVNDRAGWAVARAGGGPPPPPPPPDTTAPTISAVQPGGIGPSNATITWNTNEAADAQVEFGQTTAYGSISVYDATLVTSHAVPLSGLLANTLYHYRVKSRDAAGNLATSSDGTFTTAPPVTTAMITFDDVPGSQQALVGQYPSGVVDWGSTQWWLSGPFGAFTTKSISFNGASTPGITSASFAVLGGQRLVQIDAYNGGTSSTTVTLKCTGQPNTQISLAVNQMVTIVTGWSAGCATVTITSSNGWDTNFDNLLLDAAPPQDTTAPVISAVQTSSINETGATIMWTTNEAADSQVLYGVTTAYGSATPVDGALVTSHSVVLSGLMPNTLYHYQVRSKDAAGNAGTFQDIAFTTPDSVHPPAAPTGLHVVQ